MHHADSSNRGTGEVSLMPLPIKLRCAIHRVCLPFLARAADAVRTAIRLPRGPERGMGADFPRILPPAFSGSRLADALRN